VGGEGIPNKVICDTVGEANGEEDGNETFFEPDAQRRAVVAWFVGHCPVFKKKGEISLMTIDRRSCGYLEMGVIGGSH
jgi:hypothetical protein